MNCVKSKEKFTRTAIFFFSLTTFHFSLFILPSAYGQNAPTFADYLERLQWARQTLQEAKSPADWQEAQKTVTAAFPEEEAVIFSDGKKINLNFPLKAREGAEEKPSRSVDTERREALAVLSLYERELELTYQVKSFSAAERQKLKEQVEEILHSPEFSGYRETTWLQKLKAWVAEQLYKLFEAMGVPSTGFLKYFTYGVMTLLILLILYFIVKSLWPLFSRQPRDKKGKPEVTPLEEDFRKEDWGTRALALARQGDFRGAVRACYLGLLQILEQERLLRYNRSKTNWEYLAELSSRPRLSTPMKELTLSFDYIWYGHRALDARDYLRFHEGCEEVKNSVKVGREQKV